MTLFHKSEKIKMIYNKFKKNLWQLRYFLLFCCEGKTVKSVLIPVLNLFSFLWNLLLIWHIETMTFKKSWRFFNENCIVYKPLFFKKTNLYALGTKI